MISHPPGTPTPYWYGRRMSAICFDNSLTARDAVTLYIISPHAMGLILASGLGMEINVEARIYGLASEGMLPFWISATRVERSCRHSGSWAIHLSMWPVHPDGPGAAPLSNDLIVLNKVPFGS